MTPETPKVLLVDSYDSFTFNLAALVQRSIPNCSIHIVKNDQFTIDQLLPHLRSFSAIIVGPGPGSPDKAHDIGFVKDLWKVADEYVVPIFGVCLGLQSLCVEYGGQIKRLNVVKHGQISRVSHTGTDIFAEVKDVFAVRYHSLHVKVDVDGDILPLAWTDDGEENGLHRPFWAVQYHPESVRTDGGGLEVFQNFWRLAVQWTSQKNRQPKPDGAILRKMFGKAWPDLDLPRHLEHHLNRARTLSTHTFHLPDINVVAMCELFGVEDENSSFALLDSAAQGRFSILACLSPDSLHISHSVNESHLSLRKAGTTTQVDLKGTDVWTWISAFMRGQKALGGSPDIPFWGGLVGMLTYEIGVDGLQIPVPARPNAAHHPDINLVFVERSVVVDVMTKNVTVQSLLPNDEEWIMETGRKLAGATVPAAYPPPARPLSVVTPKKEKYISRVNECKEYLFSGDSYELCLTGQTHITTPSGSSWNRYKTLRSNNPAPHSAYMRLSPTTFLSSSPERFLSFSRPPGSLCQLRPIKGTVRKGPGVTREIAEELLAGSVKEVAENLMIVDLIRHDLHGVVGEDVQVTKFCVVEEYETVYQLVSVIEGRLSESSSPDRSSESQLGWEVLRKSLPPGSMTGAPKKRSVEILQTLEDGERMIYSGVFGYWCVSGGGDWAVTIRSCFKYDEEPAEYRDDKFDKWTIGAGGAITALSDPEAEWEEMNTKLSSVLRSFVGA
ncbi:ADC synthase [Collybia nuda]|uniref:aminodeoxychorismate synthase n=1 Tax=Collybia nuda TaxID=64659 RepID=A0A9P5XYS7_9AGAR|nr:ADC synthase [Collybia nuda]